MKCRRAIILLVLLPLFGLTTGCRKLANLRALRNQNPFLKDLPDHVIECGPVLGFASPTELTIGLKTDEDARVTLEIDNRRFVSPEPKYHRFHITGLRAKTDYRYRFDIQETEDEERHFQSAWYRAKTFPAPDQPIRFCVYGDLRTQPKVWTQTAAAMLKERPDFALALGDLVRTGADKREWRTNFFDPAAAFFASIPQYIAKGDHDEGGERWMRLFQSPNDTENWSQRIGPILLIGINLMDDWSKESHNVVWLESVLGESTAPYSLVALHAPPYASTAYGRPDRNDDPMNLLVDKCRADVLPILERHHVSALFAGHVHAYERCVLPSGLVVLTSGGAGAPLHERDENAVTHNPFSVAFQSQHHYLRVNATTRTMTVTAVRLDGLVIDNCDIHPRHDPIRQE